jgi:hypothetical protein
MRENRVRRAAAHGFTIGVNTLSRPQVRASLFLRANHQQKFFESRGIHTAIHGKGFTLHHQSNQLLAAVVSKEISIKLERGMDDVAASLHGVYFLSCPFDIIIITDNAAFVNRFLKFF